MIESIFHQHSSFKNKTVHWFTADSIEAYNENLNNPKRRKIIEDNNWIGSTIEYSFNSHGFRADEFELEKESILFLGCSFTLGTGLPYEYTWPYLVSKKLGYKNYNLGISGGSNDTAFRLGNHYIPKLKPTIVVFAGTASDRLDLIDAEDITTLRYNYIPEHLDSAFYKDWLTYKENGELNWSKNYLAIKYLCKINSIPFMYVPFSTVIPHPYLDRGRDIMHPGIKSNAKVADFVLDAISKLGDAG